MRVRLARQRALDQRRRRPARGGRRLDGVSLAPRTSCSRPPRAIRSIRSPRRAAPLPAGGLQFDIEADVFRHEPSKSLDRLQSFRMREFVRIGSPQEIVEFRERWIARAPQIADDLSLPHAIDVASDPFFGRVGQMMAVSQRQQALKFELLIPYHAGATPTACMSFNYHRDHFGQVWSMHGSARRACAHELRGVRHRSAGGRAVRESRTRSRPVAGGDAARARAVGRPGPRQTCRSIRASSDSWMPGGGESAERAQRQRRPTPRAARRAHEARRRGSPRRARRRRDDPGSRRSDLHPRVQSRAQDRRASLDAASRAAPAGPDLFHMAAAWSRARSTRTPRSAGRCATRADAGSLPSTTGWRRSIHSLPASTTPAAAIAYVLSHAARLRHRCRPARGLRRLGRRHAGRGRLPRRSHARAAQSRRCSC